VSRALDGIKVLDLSRVLAGPWCTQMLADLGCEVIKIERPGSGDDTRSWGPPYAEGKDGFREAAYYLSANRGKKSVAVDMANPEGQRVIRALAAQSDIVVENFKVGGLKRYGLDYAGLSAINPALIYCSVTGFGQTGPYAHRAGYDFVLQGMGGLMSITGEADGEPMRAGVALIDVMTGLHAVIAIEAALIERARSGLGQHLDLSLLDVGIATMANQALNYLVSGKSAARYGNAHPSIVPYQAFKTADNAITVACGNDSQFADLARTMGKADWAEDAKFKLNRDRVANRVELLAMLQAEFLRHPTAYWLEALEANNVPAGPINRFEDVFADPHVKARGMQISRPHPHLGQAPGVAPPIRMSRNEVGSDLAPPELGQHTQEVLAERLGLDEAGFAALRASGALGKG